MDARHIAPESYAGQAKRKWKIIPIVMTAALLTNGLFNYTKVSEAFVIVSIALCVAVILTAFAQKYQVNAALDDPISIAALLWCLFLCLSPVWAVNPPASFYMLCTYSAAFSFYFLSRCYTRGQAANKTYSIMNLVGFAGAAITLLSVEMASAGIMQSLYFTWFPDFFRILDDSDHFGSWVEGARMESLMGLPNVYATMAAVCFFMLLYPLVIKSNEKPSAKILAGLVINGTGLLLSGSRGGLLFFGLAALIFLLYVEKDLRFHMLLTGLMVLLWCAMTYLLMSRWMGQGTPLALLSMVIMAYLLSFAWKPLAKLIHRFTHVNRKKIFMTLGLILAFLMLYTLVALNLHTSFTIRPENASMRRATTLAAGSHPVSASIDFSDTNAAVQITVRTSNREQAALQKSDVLLQQVVNGSATGGWTGEITVPEDSAVVSVHIYPLHGSAKVESLTLGSKKIPLRYMLLPEALVSRMQGIWADSNILQRFVYWQDGLTIFAQSPIMGRGGGAFETLVRSVADSYYVTRHVHNHYIQMLVDGGIVGLLIMLACLAFAARALWKNRRTMPPGVAPCLAAVFFMVTLHSLEEASMHNLLVVAVFFIALGLISAHSAPKNPLKMGVMIKNAACVISILAVVVLGGRLVTRAYVTAAESSSNASSLSAYRYAVITDPLNASRYKSASLTRYASEPESGAGAMAEQFAKELSEKWDTPYDCYVVGRYHLKRGEMTEAAQYFERYVDLCRVDPAAWNEVLALYYPIFKKNEGIPHELLASAERLSAKLEALNGELPVRIEPDKTMMNMVFGKA